MRRYERASTLLTSNRPADYWGKLLGDTAAVTALLPRSDRSVNKLARQLKIDGSVQTWSQ